MVLVSYNFDNIFKNIGMAMVVFTMIRITYWLWLHFIRPDTKLMERYGAKRQPWALVTGAGAGIGLEMSRILYSKGFAVVGVSLPHEEATFRAAFPLKRDKSPRTSRGSVAFIGTDVSDIVTSLKRIKKRIALIKKNSGVLKIIINNVGISNKTPKRFHEHSQYEIDKLLKVNLSFCCHLTRELLPGLLNAATSKKKSALVFVSSMAGSLPSSPLVSIYGACKAALISLSNSIKIENNCNNLDVLCVTPGYVNSGRTPAWTKRSESIGIASPQVIAFLSLGKLGVCDVISPYPIHSLQFNILKILIPDYFTSWMALKTLEGVDTV